MSARRTAHLLLCACSAIGSFASDGIAEEVQLPTTGCASWAKLATVKLRGTSEAGGLRGSFKMTLDLHSGRFIVERDYGVYSEAESFDGRLTWKRDRSGASHFLDADPARAITATEVWLYRRGWCDPTADGLKVESLPTQKEDDTGQTVWRVTPKSGIPVVLRFDRATGLPRQSEVHLWSSRLVRHYSDWRDVSGGVMIPFAERDEAPEDESIETIKIDSAEASSNVADDITFARPSAPHDYGIIGGKTSATVPYQDDGIGRIFVPVLIDGNGPFAFEVDTGGHLILTTAIAKALHLQPVGNSSVTGGGTGVVHQGTIRVQEIRIGAAVIHNQPVWVLPFPDWSNDRGSRSPRAGILGLELFERFAVQLNRRGKTMTLTPLEKFDGKGRGEALPIFFIEDAPLTRGTFNSVAGDFELDSGNAGPAIIEGYWAKENGLAEDLAHGIGWGGSGIGGDYSIKLSRGDIALGPIKFPREVVSCAGLMERGSESTQLQAGVIGESSLYRLDMIYDYSRERVWIDAKTAIRVRPFNRAGIRLRKETPDMFAVVFVAPGSPAAIAGIKEGERVRSINGRSASALSTADATVIFGRPADTNIRLLVVSKTGGPERRVELRLEEIVP